MSMNIKFKGVLEGAEVPRRPEANIPTPLSCLTSFIKTCRTGEITETGNGDEEKAARSPRGSTS